MALSEKDQPGKYVITWKLHRDGSCSLRFELPAANRKPNEMAYFLVSRIFYGLHLGPLPRRVARSNAEINGPRTTAMITNWQG